MHCTALHWSETTKTCRDVPDEPTYLTEYWWKGGKSRGENSSILANCQIVQSHMAIYVTLEMQSIDVDCHGIYIMKGLREGFNT